MINILIVDDNKNNRMILNLLLEDYQQESDGPSFQIDEAENGKIAVKKAKSFSYDIIFMDIMMPEMNGIDATKNIRAFDENVMIITVSAIDDAQRQKEILASGAEDYISKPVNADIFSSRIANYISLIESRRHKKFNSQAVNLYTKEIFNRRLLFMVSSEDALSEFWDYYLLGDGKRYEKLSDVVRTLYTLGDVLLKKDFKSEIIVEDSKTDFYFTLNNIDRLGEKLIKLVMLKNPGVDDYKIEGKLISFRLSKLTATPSKVESVAVEDKVEQKEQELFIEPVSEEEHHIYSYIDVDDLEEVEIYLSKLNSLLLLVGNSDLEDDDIVEIYTYLERIAKILTVYSESYVIGQSLLELSDTIASSMDMFRENSDALAPMTTAFSNDLSTWYRMVFEDGAPSVDFLDDTISANSKMIVSMLNQDEESDEGDLDDIFDF
jgi:two-component system chemotaxis response regulator CheY